VSAPREVLTGADLVLPDRVVTGGSLVIEDGRIVDVLPHALPAGGGTDVVDLAGRLVVPGFIDVHVHGLDGIDTMDGPSAVSDLAVRMPRFGVTAFCPTTIACSPAALQQTISAVRDARLAPAARSARVLPAHLESNFINPDYRGAQPESCLRLPPTAGHMGPPGATGPAGRPAPQSAHGGGFTGDDVLAAIEAAGPDVAIVTIASEIVGGIDLVRRLAKRGMIVSLGHSAATFDEALSAIQAGARQATHLFNRMPPMGHRDPGLAGAVLQSVDLAAELVCDGYHVHPGMMRVAIAAKGADRVMAITDGSAGSGRAPGARARLGGRFITVSEKAAFLDDGTLAGSTATMDRVFRVLTGIVGLSLIDSAILCATTPARELGLQGHGIIAAGAIADLTVLDQRMHVVETYVAGRPCLRSTAGQRPG
jgi:N-acetylglucosamine-6-phosphate deacetylase